MEDQKKCLECGDVLKGRSDQKFCTDYCRNSYNNKKRSKEKSIIREIDKILHKNRSILAKLCVNGNIKTVKLALKAEGFDFNYLTNSFRAQNGNTYFYCYDYGYRIMDDSDEILIVKKIDYNDKN